MTHTPDELRALEFNAIAHALEQYKGLALKRAAEILRSLADAPAVPEVPKAVTFEQAWATYVAKGYRYGPDALEQVRFGWEIAVENLRTTPKTEEPRYEMAPPGVVLYRR
jgi:hypothetical protein